ncbi:TonB-dependent receptor [Rhodoferax ferrireducens]|uniref:TonB-dependent receptor n=1 Tax=Rhodoferax ferrireducens TaxID=192843 RepID=UPI000E0D4EFB|nr:TonB-dependent receptor [Rhodoferax ferrireducens]
MRKNRVALALTLAFPVSFFIVFPAAAQTQPAVTEPSALNVVTITGSREKTLLLQTPASVGVISAQDIQRTGPMHPQQILGQVPGVAIAVTNGEGHSTAIRQPFTTSPLYLYLEDGIPIRATGFFNHNALYEVNLAQAGGIEVVKGPGSALYGSDAIGGTVNILTKLPSSKPGLSVSGEAGSFGWRRLLVDGTTATGADGAVRAAVNLTHTDGWRDQTAYDRQSASFRHDQALADGAVLKTILGYTKIDQQTGANTALSYNDYLNNPTKNNLSIAYRKVDALRLSTQYERELGAALLTITPYVRRNAMDLNGSYNLSSDPRIEKADVTSIGVMTKWRQDFSGALKARLIVGLDLERSPGSRTEDSLSLTSTGAGADRFYTGYTVGNRIYDYDVTFKSASAYAQGELSPLPALRVSAGLRFDSLGYDMTNNIAASTTRAGTTARYYGQTASASVDYSHLSPKLAATFALSPASSVYTSYNHGFRAPSEGQLFRAGSGTLTDAATRAQLALALKPVKANQFEVGWRGAVAGWSYDLAVYQLVKKDDLVSQRDLATNVSTSVNAGKTEHQGIELALGKALNPQWRLDTALSYARHRYVDWVTASANFSGNEMETAPRVMSNTRISWTPRAGTLAQLEWVRLGDYWLEASNSAAYGKYPGHDVFNLRFSQSVGQGVNVFARLMNLTDRRYADSASVSSSTPVFSPAMPRALYAGLEATW